MSPRAIVLLGWSGLAALVKRPFKRSGALARVLRRGTTERIVSLDPADLAALRSASGCVACGRCDEVPGGAPGAAPPSDWVLAGLRDLTDWDVAGAAPGDDERLGRLEAACPARVPFDDLARSAAALRERMSADRPAGSSG